MHITAVIPARYASSRLPAKPLVLIAGKTLVQRVFEAVRETELFDKVIIATDHQEIYDHCQSIGAEVQMTSPDHPSGTDRIYEVACSITTDLIINVQGDEPFISREPLKALIKAFDNPAVNVASLMHIISNAEDIQNPNAVKVVVDNQSYAIYFSRSPIPCDVAAAPPTAVGEGRGERTAYRLPPTAYCSDGGRGGTLVSSIYKKHIGVYAYRPNMLKTFVSLPAGTLEKAERLEQLRLLEHGYKIKMICTDYAGIGIDTEEDRVRAERDLW